MSYIAGTGIIQGTGGVNSINIDVNVEQIVVNKNDIITIKADLQNISTSEVAEGSRLYYTEERVDDNIALKSTTDIAEGTNLYYTEDRVDTNIALKTTTDIAEGENLYYTEDRVDANIALKTTTDIAEGNNLYYTEERVSANIDVIDLKRKIDGYTNDEGDVINGALTKIEMIEGEVSTNIDNIETISNNAQVVRNDIYGYTDEQGVYQFGILDEINGYLVDVDGVDVPEAEQLKGINQALLDLKTKDADQDTQALATMVGTAVFEVGKYAYAKVQKGGLFGAKLQALTAADNTSAFNTFSGDAIAEIIEELNNMVDVYRYDAINNEAGINTDPITGYKLYVGGKTRINGNLEILDTGTTFFNVKDYLIFKGIKSSHNALKVDSSSKLLELNYYDRHFKDGTDTDTTKTNKFRLNLKTNGGIIEDANGLLIDVKTSGGITNDTNGLSQTFLITDAINGIERITTVGTNKDKIQSRILSTGGLDQGTTGLYIKTKTNGSIESDVGGVYVKTKVSGGITSDVSGLSQTYLITDTINGIERITTGIDKDKIQIKLKPILH